MLSKQPINKIQKALDIVRNLAIKESEEHKIWFLDIEKMFEDKKLKIMYLSFENLDKVMKSGQFQKIPDPADCLAGVTYRPPLKDSIRYKLSKNGFLPKTKLSFSKFKATLKFAKKRKALSQRQAEQGSPQL